MTTEPCQTCQGDGHVAGHWMPEMCPACDGTTEFLTYEPEVDKNAQGCCATVVWFLAVCIGVGLWQFFTWAFA